MGTMRMRAAVRVAAVLLLLPAAFAFGADGPEAKPANRDVIDVRDFGAKGDGVADDADAVQNAIAEGLKLVGGRKPDVAYDMKKYAGYGPVVVYLPRGTYLVNKPLKVPCGSYSWNRALRITGESARIKAGKPMDAVLHVNIASHITVEGLTLDGAGLAQNGFTALKISGRNGLVDRVSVNGAVSHGFALEKCQGGVFRACSSGGNGGDGWRIVDCNAAVFERCAATHNKGNGFTVTAKDFSGGCVVTGPWSEANLGDGVSVESAVSAQVVIRDGWLEANGKDGIRLASVSAHVTGMNIAGDFRDDSREGTPRQRSTDASIRLTATAAGCYIAGNQIRGGGLRGGQIRVEGKPDLHHVAGNFRLYGGRTVVPVGVDAVGE